MKKFLLILLLFAVCAHAVETLKPTWSLRANGAVQALHYETGMLYAATDNGTIDIFDTAAQRLKTTVALPPIKDFLGDKIPAKVYAIDKSEERMIIVAQGTKGFRNLWLYEDAKLRKVIGIEKKWYMRKAMFVDHDKVLIALLSNQLILFDLKNEKVLYDKQLSTSSFSDFTLSEDKKRCVATDESGIVRLIDTLSGGVLKTYSGQNLDRVYQLDYRQGTILTAGQDRRAVLYSPKSTYYLSFDFLLYSCALSPSAKLAAVAYNEENDILVYKTENGRKRYRLSGHDATLTQILFVDETHLFSSSESRTIHFWTLK